MIRLLQILALISLGSAAAAHPHVFVETEVEIIVGPDGQMTGVRLNWIYDDFFSLLVTEELGIDPDGDMVLTPEETTILTDYISDWPDDFEGDLYVTQDGLPLELGPREDYSVALVGGLVTENHVRPLVTSPQPGVPIVVQPYDPYYYVAYTIIDSVRVSGGTGCTAEYRQADLDAAYSMVNGLLDGRQASDVGPDEEFPPVGSAFSDSVIATCGD